MARNLGDALSKPPPRRLMAHTTIMRGSGRRRDHGPDFVDIAAACLGTTATGDSERERLLRLRRPHRPGRTRRGRMGGPRHVAAGGNLPGCVLLCLWLGET